MVELHLLVMQIIMVPHTIIQRYRRSFICSNPCYGTAVTSTTITVNVGISNDEPNEFKSFGGSGYSDGIFGIALKNKLGSGVGATADITVTNGSVTNVKLESAGNGYKDTDVLGISDPRVGEQLVKNFLTIYCNLCSYIW